MIESIFRKLPAFKGQQRLARVLLKSKIEQYHNIYDSGKFDCIFFSQY